MSGPYFHAEDWVGEFALNPITSTKGASTSRLGNTEASTARGLRAPTASPPSLASPQAFPSSSPSIYSPTYSPNSGPGGTPTPLGTPPTLAPGGSSEHSLGGSSPPPIDDAGGSLTDIPPAPPLPSRPALSPVARSPASPPGPPPAPIEYDDPALACIETIRCSLDRLSGDRETLTKSIETLSLNVERLEKRCEEIVARIRSQDHNDYARTMNSGVRDHTTSLEPLYDSENKIPLSFPRVVGDIRRLNTAGLNTLLSLYRIPIHGTIAMKKRKFALYIGLAFDIDV